MNDALYIAATGMQAQQAQLEAVANNVANVNTNGFKRGTVSFHDIVQRAGAPNSADAVQGAVAQTNPLPPAGAGVSIATLAQQFTPGDLKRTDNPLDLAIQGEGFIEVVTTDGAAAFSRGGALQVNPDGLLATADGLVLKQRIQLPGDARDFTIAPDGEVHAVDASRYARSLGRIGLVTFTNPAALVPQGGGLYRATPEAGDPLLAVAGEAGAGRLVQGQLEQSNVRLIDEIVQLMVAQRAYEMNVKVIQAADEIAGMTNGMRK